MARQTQPRLVRVDDFVAESLEAEADKMPPSLKDQAEILREIAKKRRASKSTTMVRVWEEQPEKTADFIRPDPASQG